MTCRDPVHLDQPRRHTGPDALMDDPADWCQECGGTGYTDGAHAEPCDECDGTGYTNEARMTDEDYAANQADADNDNAWLEAHNE